MKMRQLLSGTGGVLNRTISLFGVRFVRSRRFEELLAAYARLASEAKNASNLREACDQLERRVDSLQERLSNAQSYNRRLETEARQHLRRDPAVTILAKHAVGVILQRCAEENSGLDQVLEADSVDSRVRQAILEVFADRLGGDETLGLGQALAESAKGIGNPQLAHRVAIWFHKRGDIRSALRALSGSLDDDLCSRIHRQFSDEWAIVCSGVSLSPNRGFVTKTFYPGAVYYLLHNSLPYHSGGYATRAQGLLSALNRSGERTVIGLTRLGYPNDRKSLESIKEVSAQGCVQYEHLPDAERNLSKLTLTEYLDAYECAVLAHLRDKNPILIHAASFYHNGTVGLRVARRLGIPFIYEIRGLDELAQISRQPTWSGSERHRLFRRVEIDVAKQADHVFSITAALKGFLVENGVPSERISVLSNHVDASTFDGQRDANEIDHANFLPQAYNEDSVLVGYVGSFVDYEGLDLLLEAIAILRREVDVCGLLAGDGVQSEYLRKRVKELDLEDAVVLPGRVPFASVPRVYELLDLVVFPRLKWPICEMISPIKPFEALAAGKCVVGSDVAALREILEGDGEPVGRTFEAGSVGGLVQVLGALINDPDERQLLGLRGADWVWDKKTWNHGAQHVLEVYDRLASSRLRQA